MTKRVIDAVRDALKNGAKSTQEVYEYINRTTHHGITSSQLGSILKRKEFISDIKNKIWKWKGENNDKKEHKNNEK